MPKPEVSRWIASERKRLGWKSEELAGRLRAAGYQVAETTVRTWEAGRRQSAENIAALERLFESSAPIEREVSDNAAVVAAIDRLTEAVERQTAEQGRGMTALGEVLGDLLGRLGGLPGRMPAGSADPAVGQVTR